MGVGTFGYQAPEQVNGDPTTRSDLYSVGVIAVELFTGISPKELLTHRGVLQWQPKCYDLPQQGTLSSYRPYKISLQCVPYWWVPKSHVTDHRGLFGRRNLQDLGYT